MQAFVQGIPASVSLLICGDRYMPLSLNRQLIEPGSRYSGSEVPFAHGARERAVELACSAVSLVPGLKGYAGVDMILTGEDAQVLEINPRLTTSYIGLRQVAQTNLAGAIWDACINSMLPKQVPPAGSVTIRKDDPATWNLDTPGRSPMPVAGTTISEIIGNNSVESSRDRENVPRGGL